MAKHRKTRQEKIIADQRHISYHLETSPAQVPSKRAKNSEYSLNLPTSSAKTSAISYNYVTKDLRKTTILTALIILGQIFLFIFLNRV